MAIVQPIDYSSGNGFAQGLQLKGLQDEVQQRSIQAEEAQRQRDAALQFQKDWSESFGNPEKMTTLVAKYPGQIEAIKSGIGFQDEQHQMALGNAARDLRIAMATGNPQAIQSAALKNQNILGTIGSSADDILQQYQSNPEGLAHVVDAVGLSALGAKDYYGVENDRAQRQNDQAKLSEQMRANRASEGLQAQSNGIAAMNASIRRLELDDKKYDRQIARETNAIQLANLQDKRIQNQQALEQAKRDKQATAQGAIDTFSTALDSLNDLSTSPGLSKSVGIRSAFPTIPGSDAANFEARLDTFKAQTFLPMVASLKGMGALSDAEGKKLSDAVGALSPKMSEASFRASIGKIQSQLEGKLSTVRKQYDYQSPASNQQSPQPAQTNSSSGYSSLWGD